MCLRWLHHLHLQFNFKKNLMAFRFAIRAVILPGVVFSPQKVPPHSPEIGAPRPGGRETPRRVFFASLETRFFFFCQPWKPWCLGKLRPVQWISCCKASRSCWNDWNWKILSWPSSWNRTVEVIFGIHKSDKHAGCFILVGQFLISRSNPNLAWILLGHLFCPVWRFKLARQTHLWTRPKKQIQKRQILGVPHLPSTILPFLLTQKSMD